MGVWGLSLNQVIWGKVDLGEVRGIGSRDAGDRGSGPASGGHSNIRDQMSEARPLEPEEHIQEMVSTSVEGLSLWPFPREPLGPASTQRFPIAISLPIPPRDGSVPLHHLHILQTE